MRQLTTLLRKAAVRDTVLVYFACHGTSENGQTFLTPRDWDSKSPGLTSWSVEYVRDQLKACDASQKLLILDTCHSGSSGQGYARMTGLGGDVSKTLEAGGMITFAAATTAQASQEKAELQHGVFTYALAHGLGGKADADADGIVDSDEVYRYVLADVSERTNGGQTPVRIIGGDVVGVFALARVSGEASVVPEMKPGQRLVNSIGMQLRLVMPGGFQRGSPRNEAGRDEDETAMGAGIGRPFFLGAYEVTQAEFAEVMGSNPSWFRPGGDGADAVKGLDTSRFPVEQVTWDEARDFCRRLSARPAEKRAGLAYRLPTEAEWEYACRAGTTTAFHTGPLLSSTQANVNGEKPYQDSAPGPNLGRTTTVGSYSPNAWGLHDVHGNVWEWCSDWYAENAYTVRGDTMDPQGPDRGTRRVLRGGAWSGDVALSRSASRRDQDPEFRHKTIGFRVVAVSRGP
jgi:formylglycine-generating enzyme required for sulfatase activity